MSRLRNYTCSKCAGALIVDKDQEVLDCPFCGEKIGLAQFHEEDILGDAEASLRRMEFSAARDKYEYILKGDPSNFDALRGLIFAEGHVSSLAYISRIEKLRKCDLMKILEKIEYALTNCREEDTAYFSQLLDTVSLYDEYRVLAAEDRYLKGEQQNQLGKLMDIYDKQDELNSAFSDAGETVGSVIATVAEDTDEEHHDIYASFFLSAVILVSTGVSIYIFGVFGLFIPLVIAIFTLLLRKFFVSQLESLKKPHRQAVSKISTKISSNAQKERELEKKYEDAYARLKELDPAKKKEGDTK